MGVCDVKDLKPLPIFAAVLVAGLMLVGLGWLIGSGARLGKCDCPCCDCFGVYWPSDCDCDDDPDIRPIPRPTPRDFPGWTPPTRGEIGEGLSLLRPASLTAVDSPEPWRRIEAEAYLQLTPAQPWNDNARQASLVTHYHGLTWPLHTLAFATDSDYREAIRLDGLRVQVQGVVVQSGYSRLILVESLAEIVR